MSLKTTKKEGRDEKFRETHYSEHSQEYFE